MLPTIDRKATGVNLRRIMDRRNISVKELQAYLGLGSIQSIYHWLNGISLPTVDNLYAMSALFQVSIDSLICGSRGTPFPAAKVRWEPVERRFQLHSQRVHMYYIRICDMFAA